MEYNNIWWDIVVEQKVRELEISSHLIYTYHNCALGLFTLNANMKNACWLQLTRLIPGTGTLFESWWSIWDVLHYSQYNTGEIHCIIIIHVAEILKITFDSSVRFGLVLLSYHILFTGKWPVKCSERDHLTWCRFLIFRNP